MSPSLLRAPLHVLGACRSRGGAHLASTRSLRVLGCWLRRDIATEQPGSSIPPRPLQLRPEDFKCPEGDLLHTDLGVAPSLLPLSDMKRALTCFIRCNGRHRGQGQGAGPETFSGGGCAGGGSAGRGQGSCCRHPCLPLRSVAHPTTRSKCPAFSLLSRWFLIAIPTRHPFRTSD